MKLETLLNKLEYDLDAGSLETEVSALEYDSRKVIPGSLFVCLTGFRADGHDYIPKALEAGAAALVVEREVSVPDGVAVVRVADSRAALALLAAAWFGHPADQMTVIGLTGTKGKTTTAHMLKAILEADGRRVGMIGTIGAVIAGELVKTHNTTPESYELHSLFRRMADAGCTHVVMETSSQGFKLRRTAGIRFDIGVFLNLSPDHIGPGEHEDFEEYLQCKRQLFQQCGRGLVNIDDEHWQAVTAGALCPLTTFALAREADYRAGNIAEERRPGFLGSRFTASGALSGEFMLSMPGRFNVDNALAALAAADMLGIGREAMAKGLATVQVKGRTQLLPTAEHYTLLVDYAHNAVSMENLLTMLRAYLPHRLICVYGSGGNRSPVRRYDVGEIGAKYADLSVLTMDNPRDEEVEDIIEDIKVGLARHDGKYISIPDRTEAIHWVIDHAEDGDIIALLGKGHEEYQEIKGVRYYFSEEQIALDYLASKEAK